MRGNADYFVRIRSMGYIQGLVAETTSGAVKVPGSRSRDSIFVAMVTIGSKIGLTFELKPPYPGVETLLARTSRTGLTCLIMIELTAAWTPLTLALATACAISLQ